MSKKKPRRRARVLSRREQAEVLWLKMLGIQAAIQVTSMAPLCDGAIGIHLERSVLAPMRDVMATLKVAQR